MLHSKEKKHIFFGWFHLYIIRFGTYFGSCMGRFKRWESDWTCDIPRITDISEGGRGEGELNKLH